MHPDYDPADFVTRDVGVVVLDEAFPLAEYGALPALDSLTRWPARRKQDTTFTTRRLRRAADVPEAAAWKIESQRLRMVATPRLVQVELGRHR